jgi:hypothetical protein
MTPEQIKDSIIAVQEGLNPTFRVLETWIGSGKITIDRVFEIGIRHNYAVAIANLIDVVLVLIFLSIIYLVFRKIYSWVGEKYEREWVYVPFLITVIVVIPIIIVTIDESIKRIIAPEWSTINDFIEMLKNK